ncbi:MAG: hypothetical protein ACYDD2_10320 [Candidatus Acidiferrales bacterium]
MAKVIVDWLTPIGTLVAAFGTLGTAVWAVRTYGQSVNLARARWMKDLYEKFYEQPQLKLVRDRLDSDDEQDIAKLVRDEDPSFTDYLNFFEFLAYLEESRQVKRTDLLGIFGYYLENLKSCSPVIAYIKDPTKGFEKLRRTLKGNLQ